MIIGGERLLGREPFRTGLTVLAILAIIVPAPGGQERFRKTPPLPESLKEIALPELNSFVLTNGLEVIVTPQSGQSLVLIQLIVPAGLSDSPEDLPALAAFAAHLISRGTEVLSADDVESRIESMGGEFSIAARMDYTVFRLRVLRENLEPALTLLSAMVLGPGLREREIDNLKRTMFYEIRAQDAQPEFFGKRQLLRILFGNHPYARAAYNEDIIRLISQKRVADFIRTFYRPNNAKVVVSGDIDPDTGFVLASRYFNTWPRRASPEPAARPPLSPNDRPRIAFVDFPGSGDAHVFVGNLTVSLTGEKYYPFLVLNHILGGTTNSRLFMKLRESKGYAFNASSQFEFYRLCGMYWAQARLTPEALVPGIREIRAELESLANDQISPAEIEEAKAFLIGNLPLRFESPSVFADMVTRQVAMGLGDGHWRGLAGNLIRVNAARTREIAQEVFGPKPVVLVLGRSDVLLDGLVEAFGAVEIYDPKKDQVQTIVKEK